MQKTHAFKAWKVQSIDVWQLWHASTMAKVQDNKERTFAKVDRWLNKSSKGKQQLPFIFWNANQDSIFSCSRLIIGMWLSLCIVRYYCNWLSSTWSQADCWAALHASCIVNTSNYWSIIALMNSQYLIIFFCERLVTAQSFQIAPFSLLK